MRSIARLNTESLLSTFKPSGKGQDVTIVKATEHSWETSRLEPLAREFLARLVRNNAEPENLYVDSIPTLSLGFLCVMARVLSSITRNVDGALVVDVPATLVAIQYIKDGKEERTVTFSPVCPLCPEMERGRN